jgi:hypothetical protein
MRDIRGVRVTFKKGDLAHLDQGRQKILCVFPHILNRLKILESQVFAHLNVAEDESLDNTKREMAICAFVESIILIAGELKEAAEAVTQCYHATQVSKTLNSTLSVEVKAALKRLPGHFAGDALTVYLRNNFAYHNSSGVAVGTLDILPADDELAFYVLKDDNNYFEYANRLRIAAIAQYLKLDDWTMVVRPLADVVMRQVFDDVYHVLNGILVTILNGVQCDRVDVTVKNVLSTKEIRSDVFSHWLDKEK